MYLVEELMVDPLENHMHLALTYYKRGVVHKLSDVSKEARAEVLVPEGWPLAYANNGKPVKRLRITKLSVLQKGDM